MSVECFLDTNVLVYATAGRGTEEEKRKRALELIESKDFGLSAQVLQEFYVTVTRKVEIPLTVDQALEWIEQLETFPNLAIDANLVKIAIEISERYRISYWDGAIIAATKALGADTLYSEDLNDEQFYGSVRVCNPFR
jgi:predicted nucleic acid-binding protein